ncbi:MAG TPA: DUF2807 domain-containing protein [Flavobacterium sp.]|jgi:hypothetical protein
MIKVILALVLALLSFICNAQVSEDRSLADFSKIAVSGGVSVVFTQGATQPVKIEADSQQHLQKITTVVESGVLRIGIANEHGNQAFKKRNVYVQQPHVTEFEISSGASVKLKNGIMEPKFALSSTSGARFSGDLTSDSVAVRANSGALISGKLTAKTITINAGSGASVSFTGKTDSITISADSGSSIACGKVISQNAVVNATSGSSVGVTATAAFTANADDSSSIRYSGNPTNVLIGADSRGTIRKN